jgi:hypothetical protein
MPTDGYNGERAELGWAVKKTCSHEPKVTKRLAKPEQTFPDSAPDA